MAAIFFRPFAKTPALLRIYPKGFIAGMFTAIQTCSPNGFEPVFRVLPPACSRHFPKSDPPRFTLSGRIGCTSSFVRRKIPIRLLERIQGSAALHRSHAPARSAAVDNVRGAPFFRFGASFILCPAPGWTSGFPDSAGWKHRPVPGPNRRRGPGGGQFSRSGFWGAGGRNGPLSAGTPFPAFPRSMSGFLL